MKKIPLTFYIFGVYLMLLCQPAAAMLELELTKGINDALPIAISTFTNQGQANEVSNTLQSVIDADLKNSGRFRLVDTSVDLSNTIDYAYWHSQKVDHVVTGNVKKISGDRYEVYFALHDVYGKTQLLTQTYPISASQARSLAHHISDLIFEKIIGIRGIFSTKIAFILVERHTPTNTDYKLQVADADGYNQHTLVSSHEPLMSISWSPDGKRIAYVSFEGNRAAIYSQDVINGSRHIVSKFSGINGAPAWSPDGQKLALVLTKTGDPKIYVLDLNSNQLTQITDGWSLDTEPCWSPDGKSIIFTSNRSGNPQIYQANVATHKVERVTYQGKYNARATFTPDGSSLILLHQDGSDYNIATYNLSTNRINTLTHSALNESPSLAPNGNMIVYATNHNGRGVLAAVSFDGRIQLTLPEVAGEVQEPAWSPFLK